LNWKSFGLKKIAKLVYSYIVKIKKNIYKMRNIIKLIVLGYTIGVCLHHYNPQVADWILMVLIPNAISLDNAYVAWQTLNNPVAVASHLTLIQIESQSLYAQLLPTLGYDFVSQFDEVGLLSLYLQQTYFNIELSLEQFLTNASIHSLATLVGVYHHSSSRKEAFFTSIIWSTIKLTKTKYKKWKQS